MSDEPGAALDAGVGQPWSGMVAGALERAASVSQRATADLARHVAEALASEVATALPPGGGSAGLARRIAAAFPDLLAALAQSLAAPVGGGFLGTAAALAGVMGRLARARALLRSIAEILEEQLAARALLRTGFIPPPLSGQGKGRWQLTDAEVKFFQARVDRGSPAPVRTRKLLDAFRQGPIPQTEDADGLLLRTRQAEIMLLAPVPCPLPGYTLLRQPLEPNQYLEIGKAVHAAAERRLRVERAGSTLVFDALVLPPGARAGTHLARYASADPGKGGRDLRLRVLWETFKWYSGDTPRGRYLDLRADLVDIDALELWEVKPRRALDMGAIQSWIYRARYNAAWAPYAVGQSDRSTGFLRWGGQLMAQPAAVAVGADLVAVMATHPFAPGLVMYDIYQKRNDDEQRRERVVREVVRRALERSEESQRQQPVRVSAGQPAPARPAPAPLPQPSAGQGQGQPAPSPAPGDQIPSRPPVVLPDKPPANDNEEGEGEKLPAAAKVALLLSILLGMLMLILGRGAPLTPRFGPATGGGAVGPFGPYEEAGPNPYIATARPVATAGEARLRAEVDRVMADLASLGFPTEPA